MTESVESLRELAAHMCDPDPVTAAWATECWVLRWEDAVRDVRQYNDRRLLHNMLDTGYPVPAESARQLLDLKGPPNRAPSIRADPEEVVTAVYIAIEQGYKFPASNGSSDENNAFAVVARWYGCKPSAVRAYYRQVPAEERKRVKQEVEESFKRDEEDEEEESASEPEDEVIRFYEAWQKRVRGEG